MSYLKRRGGKQNLGSFYNPVSHRRGLPMPPLPVRFAPRRSIRPIAGMQNQSLSGFFSTIADSLKRTNLFPITLTQSLISGGPSSALQTIKDEGHAAAGDFSVVGKPIGAIVSVFNPVVGGAIGALSTVAQGDVSRQRAQAQALAQTTGNSAQLIAAYKALMGQVAGRDIGDATLRQVVSALTNAGGYPPIRTDSASSPTSVSSWDMAQRAAQAGLARGAKTAEDVFANEWRADVSGNPQHAWALGMYVTPGNAQRQVFVDMIDAALAMQNPNVPYSYGYDAAAPAPPPAPAPSIAVATAAPQVPSSSSTAPMMTTQPLNVQNPAAIAAANDAARSAAMSLMQMQQQLDALHAQLASAQQSGNTPSANQTAAQMLALQAEQARAAQQYAQAVQATQPQSLNPADVANLVASQLHAQGIVPSGAVNSGIVAGSSPTIFGIPQTTALILGALGLGGAIFLLRRRPSR
jgi:hypothetical protein